MVVMDLEYNYRPAVSSVLMQQDRVSKHGGWRATEHQTVLLVQIVSCCRMDEDQKLNQNQTAAHMHVA